MSITNTEAFASLNTLQYSNADLVTKIFADRTVIGSSVYSGSVADRENLDLCLADLYIYVAVHPDYGEGTLKLKYNTKQLINRAKEIYTKYEDYESLYGLDEDGKIRGAISGVAVW